MPPARLDKRAPDELRPLVFHRRWTTSSAGSVLVELGRTRVLCTVSVEDGVPTFLKDSGQGWLTAEYSMLPGSTSGRKNRDRAGKVDGRSVEIQRLIGRALRSIVDRGAFPRRTLWVDCDVLQADGGTRVASINGAYVALHDALTEMKQGDMLKSWPLTDSVQAVSVGLVGGEPRVDLTYYEDSQAEVDVNLVGTGSGRLIEVSGGAEQGTFGYDDMDLMVAAGKAALTRIAEMQVEALKG